MAESAQNAIEVEIVSDLEFRLLDEAIHAAILQGIFLLAKLQNTRPLNNKYRRFHLSVDTRRENMFFEVWVWQPLNINKLLRAIVWLNVFDILYQIRVNFLEKVLVIQSCCHSRKTCINIPQTSKDWRQNLSCLQPVRACFPRDVSTLRWKRRYLPMNGACVLFQDKPKLFKYMPTIITLIFNTQ